MHPVTKLVTRISARSRALFAATDRTWSARLRPDGPPIEVGCVSAMTGPLPRDEREMPRSSRAHRFGRGKGHRTIAGLLVVAVVVAGTVAIVLWRRSGAHEASTRDAQRRFERSSSTQRSAPSVLRPAAGVYLYRGTGTEHLTLPPKTQSQGPRMPATVTDRADGCWTFRIDYNSAHWQTWIYCPRNGGLVELGGQTFERWDFVVTKYDSTSTFTCDPVSVAIRATMHAGDVWQQSCAGTSSGTKGTATTSGPYTFVGRESVVVGGAPVAAYHFHQVRTLSGSQTGTQDTDLWFAVKDGLPLRNDRTVSVHTNTIIGRSTYTEHGSFELTSLIPQT